MKVSHNHLWSIVKIDTYDYKPWGTHPRVGGDCSCGCRWYVELEGRFGADWGVCTNPESHRCGLLTFEHQGCTMFEADDE